MLKQDLFPKSSDFTKTPDIRELSAWYECPNNNRPLLTKEAQGHDRCGSFSVLVECNRFNFRAIVKRALFYTDELVGPDELFLGTGCQAIHVRLDEMEFDYPVTLCGIETQLFYDGFVIHSWLTYTPRNESISAELRLQCVLPSSYVSSEETPSNTEMNKTIALPPPAQHWFLIQYRYCMRCDCAHFRDNWSRPFYGPHNHSLQRH
ncbi:oocyte-secreted protein 3-like [Tupaia chinensis]|uniref:oocyte-secreted protein 3-like n=1 Tax=Tupaia chinensis TaxID=246437 RepID=UPI000FFBAEED|nr:oocyte-secreted protein 3-like [Tupaia chinensis]